MVESRVVAMVEYSVVLLAVRMVALMENVWVAWSVFGMAV
jgi:hypothetical protein